MNTFVNSFEFEWKDRVLRFEEHGEIVRVYREDGKYYRISGEMKSTGIRALIARHAQWREAWTELVMLARLIDEHLLTGNMKQTKFTERINDLQRRVDAMGGTK